MNTMTDNEMNEIVGGMAPSDVTLLGEYLAADGLTYMDSDDALKSTGGLFMAAAGGWLWAIGSFYDGLRSLW